MDREIKPKYRKLRKILMIAVPAVIIIAGIVAAFVSSSSTSYQTDSKTITFGEVTKGEFNDFIRFAGKVETGTIVQVSSIETGVVVKKWVEEGAMVNEGDIILTLDNPNLQEQILTSESQLAERQNMLRETELAMDKERLQMRQDLLSSRTEVNRLGRILNQQKELYAEKLVSKEEYTKAKEDYDLAKEKMELLKERIRQDESYRSVQVRMMRESLENMQRSFALVRNRADNLNIKASHSGQLGTLNAELGQNVAAGQLVGQINILDNYKITANIDEHYIDRISPGLTGEIDRNGSKMAVSVKKIYPEVNSGHFRIDLSLDSPLPSNIRVGQSFYIDLRLGDPAQAVLVPKGQFYQASGGNWAYVVDADGKGATKRKIKIDRQNPDYYEVIEGLTPGERIITSDCSRFGEADRIIIEQ